MDRSDTSCKAPWFSSRRQWRYRLAAGSTAIRMEPPEPCLPLKPSDPLDPRRPELPEGRPEPPRPPWPPLPPRPPRPPFPPSVRIVRTPEPGSTMNLSTRPAPSICTSSCGRAPARNPTSTFRSGPSAPSWPRPPSPPRPPFPPRPPARKDLEDRSALEPVEPEEPFVPSIPFRPLDPRKATSVLSITISSFNGAEGFVFGERTPQAKPTNRSRPPTHLRTSRRTSACRSMAHPQSRFSRCEQQLGQAYRRGMTRVSGHLLAATEASCHRRVQITTCEGCTLQWQESSRILRFGEPPAVPQQ